MFKTHACLAAALAILAAVFHSRSLDRQTRALTAHTIASLGCWQRPSPKLCFNFFQDFDRIKNSALKIDGVDGVRRIQTLLSQRENFVGSHAFGHAEFCKRVRRNGCNTLALRWRQIKSFSFSSKGVRRRTRFAE